MKIDTQLYNKMPKELQELFELKHEVYCPVGLLDEQSGNLKSGFMKKGTPRLMSDNPNKHTYGEWKPDEVANDTYGDTGGASRFFYCAKASKSERNAGVNGIEKNIGHNRFDKCKKCGGYILQNPDRPSACKCEKPIREHNIIRGNYHPTVKPLKLMEYLCILTKTPTGGIVLDPFIGSGTTALACKKTDRKFIGFENNNEYVEIANKRLSTIPNRLETWDER